MEDFVNPGPPGVEIDPPGVEDIPRPRWGHQPPYTQPGAYWQQGPYPWQPAPFFPGFPWQQPAEEQQRQRCTLTKFWPKDPVPWFRLAESAFSRCNVVDPQMKFDLVLHALNEDTVEQIRDVLRTADSSPDPYEALKAELIRQCSPNVLEQLNGIVFAPELGGQPPSTLMKKLLALLPAGEPAGLLFKHMFVLRLPADLRDAVSKKIEKLSAKELADYADGRWHVRNARKPMSSVAAVTSEEMGDTVDQLADTVAAMPAISRRNRKSGKRGGGNHGGSQSGPDKTVKKQYLCRSHCRWGEKTWECADPKYCTFSGNGDAGGQ